MDKDKLRKQIIDIINRLQSPEDQWIDFAQIGNWLLKEEINYKQYGFKKLGEFLSSFDDIFEFREEKIEFDKPPVRYLRLKENIDSIDRSNAADLTNVQKPQYTSDKSPIFALGYVTNYDRSLQFLSKRVGQDINENELQANIQKSYDCNNILYYHYDQNGNPQKSFSFKKGKTVSFAVNTGFLDGSGKELFAQYKINNKTNRVSGIYFFNKTEIYNSINAYRIGTLSFKSRDDANEFISGLKSELQDEVWRYNTTEQTVRKRTDEQILESYLGTITTALSQDNENPNSLNFGKLRFSSPVNSSDGKQHQYVLFNTGLLTKYITCVLVIGEVWNSTENGDIIISNPELVEGGIKELSQKGFKQDDYDYINNKGMLNFFSKVNEIVYDANVKVDTDSLTKIIHCMERGKQRNNWQLSFEKKYSNNANGFLEDFRHAIENAVLIAKRNYKYVVPQYRLNKKQKTGEIQFLMPLYIGDKDYTKQPDFVLVLSKYEENGEVKSYTPETLIPPAWAYNNARVICKPENTWLDPDKIQDCSDIEDDFDD